MVEKKLTSLDFFLQNCADMSSGKILVFDTETTRNGIMFQIAFELVQADETANNNTNIGKNIMVKEFYYDLYEVAQIQHWEKIKKNKGVFAGLALPKNGQIMKALKDIEVQVNEQIKRGMGDRANLYEFDEFNNIIGRNQNADQNEVERDLKEVYLAALQRAVDENYKDKKLSRVKQWNKTAKEGIIEKIQNKLDMSTLQQLFEYEYNLGATNIKADEHEQRLYQKITNSFVKNINTYEITNKIILDNKKVLTQQYMSYINKAMPIRDILETMEKEAKASIAITSYNFNFDKMCIQKTANRYGANADFLNDINNFCSYNLYRSLVKKENAQKFFFNNIKEFENNFEALFEQSQNQKKTLDFFVQFAFDGKEMGITNSKDRHSADYDAKNLANALQEIIRKQLKKIDENNKKTQK